MVWQLGRDEALGSGSYTGSNPLHPGCAAPLWAAVACSAGADPRSPVGLAGLTLGKEKNPLALQ